MPYTDGLGAAIAGPTRSQLAAKLAAVLQSKRAAAAAVPVAPHGIFRRIAPAVMPVLKAPTSKHHGFPGFVPITRPPVVDYMPLPTPPVTVAQGVPYSASGGGQVTSGAPSPVLLSPAPTAGGDVVLDDSTPSQAGASPLVMLLLAGLAVGFLLKKKR